MDQIILLSARIEHSILQREMGRKRGGVTEGGKDRERERRGGGREKERVKEGERECTLSCWRYVPRISLQPLEVPLLSLDFTTLIIVCRQLG